MAPNKELLLSQFQEAACWPTAISADKLICIWVIRAVHEHDRHNKSALDEIFEVVISGNDPFNEL